jgi:hypothetical protein
MWIGAIENRRTGTCGKVLEMDKSSSFLGASRTLTGQTGNLG